MSRRTVTVNCEHFNKKGEQVCVRRPTQQHVCHDGDVMFICDKHACARCEPLKKKKKTRKAS